MQGVALLAREGGPERSVRSPLVVGQRRRHEGIPAVAQRRLPVHSVRVQGGGTCGTERQRGRGEHTSMQLCVLHKTQRKGRILVSGGDLGGAKKRLWFCGMRLDNLGDLLNKPF